MEVDGIPKGSLTEQTISPEEAIKIIYQLSYKKVGDQQTHLNCTHELLVVREKWLSDSAFKQIRELCWNLPGPTSLQMLLTIVILKTKSISTGVRAFFVYNTISWVIISIVSVLSCIFVEKKEDDLNEVAQVILMGCIAAASGIMVRNFINFFRNFFGNGPKMALILVTALIFFVYPSPKAIVFCMLMSGMVSLYIQIEDNRKKMSIRSENLFKNLGSNFILGKTAMFLMVAIFFTLWLYFSIYPDDDYSYIFGFYLVGCLIIGPIEANFAYFLAMFYYLERFHHFHIWIGLPLSFLIPGTHLNIGIYFGAMIDGVTGAILAAIFIFLPCFLSLFGLLPEWRSYRDRQGVRRLYQGLTCSTTGLTLAIILLALKRCMKDDVSSTLCIFFVSSGLNLIIYHYSFWIVLLGGFLAYMRYISLKCYRYGQYCPFPFNF